ncbi:MAG TPA: polysaccharide biosynthesis tyrosine autokinase [Actinomycetota bacterium]|nr:polysaccharide biosynthesis tyrosine autokinase [Actinomycetota bacterium]
MSSAGGATGSDLNDYLQVLRYRKWSVLAIAFVVILSALAFTFQQTPIYTSSAQVNVVPSSLFIAQQGQLVPPNMDTEKGLAQSESVATIVEKNLNLTISTKSLLDNLAVSVPTNTEILQFSYSSPKAAQAQQIAQGFADAYLQFRKEAAVAQVQDNVQPLRLRVRRIDSRLEHLATQIARTADPATLQRLQSRSNILQQSKSNLQTQIANITPSTSVQVGSVVAPAELPSAPSSPSLIKNMLLAVLVGVALGTGVAFLRERLDEHFTDRAELQAHVGASVLAVVPKVRGSQGRVAPILLSSSMPQSVAADAYRTLRAGVLFAASRTGAKVILVTSAFEGEGKTTTAANLAVALAQAGKRVILLSADLRKPRLHEFFGGSSPIGLATVLAGQTSIDRALVPSSIDELQILFSGGVRENAAELIGSEAMGRVLDNLRERSDFVIVDAAPILLVADTASLLPHTDGVLLVVDPAVSTRAAADDVREQLDQLQARRIGIVINNLEKSRARAYRHHAGYYSYYQDRPQRETRSRDEHAAPKRPPTGDSKRRGSDDSTKSSTDVPAPK